MTKWIHNNVENNAWDCHRFMFLIMNISHMIERGIEGSFAELGVYKGNSAAVMMYYARKAGRKLYLFDTFEGFDDKDLEKGEINRKNQFSDTSIDAVKEVVGEGDMEYIKGRFPDSISQVDKYENEKY